MGLNHTIGCDHVSLSHQNDNFLPTEREKIKIPDSGDALQIPADCLSQAGVGGGLHRPGMNDDVPPNPDGITFIAVVHYKTNGVSGINPTIVTDPADRPLLVKQETVGGLLQEILNNLRKIVPPSKIVKLDLKTIWHRGAREVAHNSSITLPPLIFDDAHAVEVGNKITKTVSAHLGALPYTWRFFAPVPPH